MTGQENQPGTTRIAMDLNAACARIVVELRAKASRGIKIGFDGAPEPAAIVANPGEIDRILVDLIAGAAGALAAGERLAVEVSRTTVADSFAELFLDVPAGRYIVLSAKDTSRNGQEAEADLSVARRLIAANGGVISVHRTQGVGSMIRVLFPEAESKLRVKASRFQTSPSGTETILLVEDDTSVRTFLRMLLAEAGYDILDAANGDDAILLGDRYRGPIHLLLTDMALPGMSGTEIARSILRRRPEIAVLRMSGHWGDEENCIHKPFDPADLLMRIRSLLDSRKSTGAEEEADDPAAE